MNGCPSTSSGRTDFVSVIFLQILELQRQQGFRWWHVFNSPLCKEGLGEILFRIAPLKIPLNPPLRKGGRRNRADVDQFLPLITRCVAPGKLLPRNISGSLRVKRSNLMWLDCHGSRGSPRNDRTCFFH